MGQSRSRARFLFEPSQPIGVSRKGCRDNFDRDVPAQARVVGTVDLAHSSGANEFANLEGSDLAAGRHGLGGSIAVSRRGPPGVCCGFTDLMK